MSSTAFRAPAIFISHGGPPTMFDTQHLAYKKWQSIGKELLGYGEKLKGIVIVSAHWQAEDRPKGVYINTNETNPLVYDFYGFPSHYYSQTFKSSNPKSFSTSVASHLNSHGIEVQQTNRGLDHGVFVPFIVSFNKELTPKVPLVQVSLPRSEDPLDSLKLGLALRGLREQGIAIVGGGMSVHNLRDFMTRMRSGNLEKPDYASTFIEGLNKALLLKPEQGTDPENSKRWKESIDLFQRKDFLEAHPTPEHLLPAFVSLGASHDDEQGKEIFDLNEGAMCWNMYQWG